MGIFDIFKKPESESEEQPGSEPQLESEPEPEPQPEEQPVPEESTPVSQSVPQPPTSTELPPGHLGEPSAAAASSAYLDAEQKTTEPVVPIFNPDQTEPTPKSFIDTQTIVTPEAQQAEEVLGESATEEVKAREQGETLEQKLEQEKQG